MSLNDHTWTVRHCAEYFGESEGAFRSKRGLRELAGFPLPQPRISDREPFKWIAAEVRSWDQRNRGRERGDFVAVANDTVAQPPASEPASEQADEIARARARLMAKL